ncbi:MAG: hypothetical protein GF355_04080, partial [Candidatus Eisenbacteria bacterium]|nr:hypothetical protein [Candidatus Eisenbacteria bacterium]
MTNRSNRSAGGAAGLRRHGPWLLAVALVPLVFHAAMVLGQQEPAAPDTQAVRPLGQWALESEERLGTLPLWCPAIFSGMPSYGSFIYTPAAAHHLFDLLMRPFPGHRGARYFLAMLLGGWALYALGLRLGLTPLAATGGALLFVLTPYMMGVIQAGHSTKLRALYHVPLLFLGVELLLRRPGPAAAAFLALALALLGWTRHPQIAYLAVMTAALYALARLIWLRPPAWRGKGWLLGAAMVVVAALLAGGMLLDPVASVREYAPYSVRGDPGVFAAEEDVSGGTPWDYATAWSFHPKELISFLVPEWFGLEGSTYWGEMPFTQSTHYFGVVALALAVAALILRRERRLWIWTALALVVLVIGFGRHVPLLYRPMFLFLPYFNKFRVPSMIYALLPLLLLPVVGAGLRMLQDETLPGAHHPAPPRGRQGGAAKRAEGRRAAKPKKGQTPARPPHGWILYATVGCGILLLIWLAAGAAVTESLAVAAPGEEGWFQRAGDAGRFGRQVLPALMERRQEMFQVGMARTLFLLTLLGVVMELRRRRLLPGFWAALLALVLLVGDVWVVGKRFQRLEPKQAVEAAIEPDATLRYLDEQEGSFRFLPLDASGSNQHAALGLQSIMGYQPAKLRVYQDLIDAGGLQSLPVLDMLQTRYLVADRSADIPGFERVREGERIVYQRTVDLPRVWLVEEVQTLTDARAVLERMSRGDYAPFTTALTAGDSPLAAGARSAGTAELLSWSAHTLEVGVVVEPPGPGLLVFSEVVYPPGWRVTVDGEVGAIHTVNHCVRAVE